MDYSAFLYLFIIPSLTPEQQYNYTSWQGPTTSNPTAKVNKKIPHDLHHHQQNLTGAPPTATSTDSCTLATT